MKKCKKIFLVIIMIVPTVAFAQVPDTKKMYNIMNKVFKASNFANDFSCTLTLINEKPNEPKSVIQFKLYRRDGSNQTCIVQLAPEIDKGTGYLQEGDNLWIYDPTSHQFKHSSLKKNLNNTNTKISDLNSKLAFSDMYKITKIEESKVGKYPVYLVSADALLSDATYSKVKYFVRKDNNLLLKIKNYGASGRLMRTILIPKYAKLGKSNLPVMQIYKNEINKGEMTTQIFQDYSTAKIPDMVFTKAYLEKVN